MIMCLKTGVELTPTEQSIDCDHKTQQEWLAGPEDNSKRVPVHSDEP